MGEGMPLRNVVHHFGDECLHGMLRTSCERLSGCFRLLDSVRDADRPRTAAHLLPWHMRPVQEWLVLCVRLTTTRTGGEHTQCPVSRWTGGPFGRCFSCVSITGPAVCADESNDSWPPHQLIVAIPLPHFFPSINPPQHLPSLSTEALLPVLFFPSPHLSLHPCLHHPLNWEPGSLDAQDGHRRPVLRLDLADVHPPS